MPIRAFPDPRVTDEQGLLAIGGELDPNSLILAYSSGIFPWPIPDIPIAWFCPPKRAVLFFEDLHISRSLKRTVKKSRHFRRTVDHAFQEVIEACSHENDRKGKTWITSEMKNAYVELHKLGYAHSFEIWDSDQLVGGIYGVEVKGVFSAESMFYRQTDASKLAFLFLVEFLRNRAVTWIDIQMMTPHMEKLGAKEIKRDQFLSLLAEAHQTGLKPFSPSR